MRHITYEFSEHLAFIYLLFSEGIDKKQGPRTLWQFIHCSRLIFICLKARFSKRIIQTSSRAFEFAMNGFPTTCC